MVLPVPDRVPPLRVKRRRRDATLHRRVAVRTASAATDARTPRAVPASISRAIATSATGAAPSSNTVACTPGAVPPAASRAVAT